MTAAGVNGRLRYLAECYFHQDYDLYADTPIGVVEHFIAVETAGVSLELLAELQELFRGGLTEKQAQSIWAGEFHADYEPLEVGSTYLEWFTELRDLLAKQAL